MISYENVVSDLSEEWNSDIDELTSILFKSAMAVLFFGVGIGIIFFLRDFLTGVGDSIVISLITGALSLLILYACLDLIIGTTRAKVIEDDYNFDLEFYNPFHDSLKCILSFGAGISTIMLATSASPSNIDITQIENLNLLKPIYHQLIVSSLVVFSVAFFAIGFYLLIAQILFLKVNYQSMRKRLRRTN